MSEEQAGGERSDGGWLGVELRHLAALAAIAQEGSFRLAARRLGYVQSAISQQIAALERIVGATLVDRERGSGTVRLSAKGRLMLRHAEGVLAEVQAARADLACVDGHGHALRVGATHDVATHVLPRMAGELHAPLADGTLVLVERSHDTTLLELVDDGALDLAFAELPLPEGPYRHLEVAASPWRLYGGPEDGTVTVDVLARLPLVGSRSSRAFAEVETRLAREAGTPRIVFRADVWLTVRALVDASIGAALIPALLSPSDHAGCSVGVELPPFRLAVLWHRERRLPELAQRFTAIASRELG
jgi:molybdate transport repressor ModE-like protein